EHLIARLAQDQGERAPDLRIVIADENALRHRSRAQLSCRVRPAPAAAGSASASGNSITKLVPCPSIDSTLILPPLSSRNPFVIASPRPGIPKPAPRVCDR